MQMAYEIEKAARIGFNRWGGSLGHDAWTRHGGEPELPSDGRFSDRTAGYEHAEATPVRRDLRLLVLNMTISSGVVGDQS